MSTADLLVCNICGTQFSTSDASSLTNCRICDDPRQYVPPTGQTFTTLSTLRSSPLKYTNTFTPFPNDPRFTSITTTPKFAIGQRCILIRTPIGNILWDCVTYLDDTTISHINSLGGIAAIVISHPHFYSTHLEWAEAFNCPVYISREEEEWLNRRDDQKQRFIEAEETELELEIAGQKQKPDIKILKLGGHFPGSLVLLVHGRLLVADTLMTTPAGVGDWSIGPPGAKGIRPPGLNTYTFMWSIPNMIPLGPDVIAKMWQILKNHDFQSTHGVFVGADVYDGGGGSEDGVKKRVLDSMRIQVKGMGWGVEVLGEV